MDGYIGRYMGGWKEGQANEGRKKPTNTTLISNPAANIWALFSEFRDVAGKDRWYGPSLLGEHLQSVSLALTTRRSPEKVQN